MCVAAFSFVLHFVSGRKLGYFNKGGEKRFRFTHYYYYSNLYHLPHHYFPNIPPPPIATHYLPPPPITYHCTFPHLPLASCRQWSCDFCPSLFWGRNKAEPLPPRFWFLGLTPPHIIKPILRPAWYSTFGVKM